MNLRHARSNGHVRRLSAGVVAATSTALFLGLAAGQAGAAERPPAPSKSDVAGAHRAAASDSTLETLERFFARDGRISRSAADPKVAPETVPVHHLSPDFVAGKKGAPVARLEFLASEAVSSDGQKASLWTARQGDRWQVVNIATGDDETRYAALGAKKVPGGTVFLEPQIGAWFVADGRRVLPLDKDAVKAVGAKGVSLAGYRNRVHEAYGDKLPGSAYDRDGMAGGFGAEAGAPAPGTPVAGPAVAGPDVVPQAQEESAPAVPLAAGAGVLAALGLGSGLVLRARRGTR